jgi:hypothetical protein
MVKLVRLGMNNNACSNIKQLELQSVKSLINVFLHFVLMNHRTFRKRQNFKDVVF